MFSRNYIILGIIFVFVLIQQNINAQDFEVAPVRLEFVAEPGDNQTKILNVKNHSNKKTSFIIALGDFLPSNDGDKKSLPPNSTKRSCANWLNINPSFFELNPGDDIQIQVSMLVPNDEFSAAWCMLYIQPSREQTSWAADKNLGAGITVSGRIGVQIYQSPKSNSNHSIKINNISETTKLGDKERKFVATLENLGDKVTICNVYLIASNMKTTEEKQFTAQEVETFPKMSRTVELTLPNDLAPGSYALAAIVDYGPKYSLEGTQILIEIKDQSKIFKADTTGVVADSTKVK